MHIYDMKPLLLVQHGHSLLKVSTVYPTYITAQVLLDVGRTPSRTTVRSYQPADIAAFKAPSPHILNRYEDLTGQKAYA